MLNLCRALATGIAAVLVCAGASAAADPVWNADPVHSSAEFTATHLGISHVSGVIPIKSVTLEVPASSNIPTKIQAELNPTGLDTRNGDRDDDLRSAHFFEVATYPTMSFVSTAIAASDTTHFTVVGNLTMHGVTKPVTLTAEYFGRMVDSRHRSHIAYEAKATIDRTQWGMTYGNPFAGYSIDLNLSVEAVRS